MREKVNDLLFFSRLPSRFFALLTGEQSVFKNAGNAVRSYVIANCLQEDSIDVTDPLLPVYLECKAFTLDEFVFEVLIEKLTTNGDAILNQASQINPVDPMTFRAMKMGIKTLTDRLDEMVFVHTSCMNTPEMFANIIHSQEDPTSALFTKAMSLRQSMFDADAALNALKTLVDLNSTAVPA